ncbi:MAG: hypothetical protein HY727_16945 [Candidatus Rokubacteria bacterium]|nr:hypothetical protein [Candidatus Rokubacteria bacterium]
MRHTVRKLEVEGLEQLRQLVSENLDGIEPGLTVIDSRLLLGHATVDLVALDAKRSLVLILLGTTADERMLLTAMDAYAWCLEYPDTISRLYPMASVVPGRAAHVIFVVEHVADAFARRVRQLNVPEIDCVEFRHLDVDGTPAAYFDVIERIRRAAPTGPVAPSPVAPAPAIHVAPPMVGPVRPSVPARVAETIAAAPPVSDDRLEVLNQLLAESLAGMSPSLRDRILKSEAAPSRAIEAPVQLNGNGAAGAPAPTESGESKYVFAEAVKLSAPVAPPAHPAATDSAEAQPTEPPKSAAPEPPAAPAPEAPRTPVAPPTAARVSQPTGSAGESTSRPAASVSKAPEPAVPQPETKVLGELDSLQFPGGGLSRQWLEFLNQLQAAK